MSHFVLHFALKTAVWSIWMLNKLDYSFNFLFLTQFIIPSL